MSFHEISLILVFYTKKLKGRFGIFKQLSEIQITREKRLKAITRDADSSILARRLILI